MLELESVAKLKVVLVVPGTTIIVLSIFFSGSITYNECFLSFSR